MSVYRTPAARRAELERFGSRVRVLRLAAGLTQQELADACGLNRVTLVRIEGGLHDFGSSRVRALAEALGVVPGSLWE